MMTESKSVLNRLFLLCALLFAVSAGFSATIELSGTVQPVQLLSSDEQGLAMRIQCPRIESSDVQTGQGEFTQIQVPGFASSKRLGEPQLPVLRKIIAVPMGAAVSAAVTSYDINEITLADHGVTHRIFPAQPSLSKGQNAEDVAFVYRPEAYAAAGYPEQPLVRTEELGILRGLRLFVVTVEPIRYDPVAQTLAVYDNLEVSVSFSGGYPAATHELRRSTFSPYYESIYSQFVLNSREIGSLDEDLTSYPIRYVIVSDPMFAAQLAEFVEWKQEKGFDVIVGYTNDPDVGTTTTSIQAYVQGLYNDAAGTPADPKPTFVLFVGDNNLIPAFTGSAGSHITDLNYVNVTGDLMPEMYFGRFSARDTGQLQPQIDKTLEYERYEMPDPSYLSEAVMIAGVDASYAPTYGNGQINYGTSNYFNPAHGITSYTYLYPASGSSDAQIIQDVSNGVGYCNYTAHGSQTSWGDPSFTVTDVNSLTNAHMYPTVVGNCCLTNSFQVETCLGEAWLRAANKGSVGYIGGSNNTYWDEDYWWGVGAGAVSANPTYAGTGPGAYDGMFHDHGETFPAWYTCQYAFIMAGNLAVVEGGGAVNYYWEIYQLMGDPSLSTYFGVPAVNNVTHSNQVFIGAGTLTVQAAAFSYVGLSKDGVQLASGLVDATGQIVLQFTPFSSVGTADLVVTRQNRQPYFGAIDVIPNDGPYVVLDAYSPSSANYGQTVSLDVTLFNVGTETASNVTATLTLTDPYVTLLDGTETFETIGSNGSVTHNAAYSIQIPAYVPDEHLLRFTLTITGTALDTWISYLDVVLNAPVLSMESVVVNDNAGGNGNGRMDPGENVSLTVPYLNEGHAASPAGTVTLGTTSEWVTINGATQALAAIPAGNTGSVSFPVSISPSCPVGTPTFFTCDLDAGAYDQSTPFMRQVGLDLEDFETGDFSLYPWTQGGSAPWTVDASDPYEGVYSAKSGTITHNQTSELFIFTEWVEAGEISFYYKVSSESDYDYLRFSIDGVELGAWSGTVGWTQATYAVAAGGHTFRWKYTKDVSVNGGSDCAWLDYIIFPPFAAPRYPDITVSPESFTRIQLPDLIGTDLLSIGNSGDSPLSYSIFIETQCPQLSTIPFMKLGKDEADPRVNSGTLDESGGPDGYGHNWIDSDETGGPVFDWIEINALGSTVPDVDDTTITVPDIGFTFNFYGTDFSSIQICSNGWVSFTSTSEAYSNQGIPNTSDPNNLIAPFWDDLSPNEGGTVYYYADAANDRFIVEWDAVEHYGSTAGVYTFEVILYADGRIVFQYLTMTGTLTSASIGIENSTGSDGLQIAANQAYLHDNLAISISQPCNWLTVTPAEGDVDPEAPADQLTVEFNTAGMEFGTYDASIWINSNDPDEESIVVPVTLIVGNPAPDAVSDLTIRRNGGSAILEWSAVDGAGSYQIWYGSTPDFVTAEGSLLGTVPATTYTHTLPTDQTIGFYFVIAQQ